MFIIAHRGASGLEPENTLRSFKKAEELGADLIELDVRISKDGELVISHDADMLRLFGDPRLLKQLPLSEIKRISALHNREIPTLADVIANVNRDLNIHIKNHGIERQVLEAIKSFPHRVLISSTFPGVLKKIRALDGKIDLGLIIGRGELHLLPVANFLTRNIGLYSIHPKATIISLPIVKLFKLSGRKVNVWTVNTKEEFIRMQRLGVDGIITDHPELMKIYGN
ncbi:MAG TPA: glycerophosphodiester phosphodiesterase [Patescibacteria group bacterium]|nr:glycerophosphodiester phosphodiesterase [Patescibacteria group bacterium]